MSLVTYTNGWNGIVLDAKGSEPIKTEAGLLVTRSVETQAGWVGQIIIDKVIVWESEPVAKDGNDKPETTALRQANKRVIERLAELFA